MNHDLWLINEADAQYCRPEVIESGYEYEGGGEYSTWFKWNCQECKEKSCEYWSKYNE